MDENSQMDEFWAKNHDYFTYRMTKHRFKMAKHKFVMR